jgi:cell division protein FtsL
MANNRRPKVRIRFGRTSPLLKVLLIVMLIVCTVSLLTLRAAITDAEAQTELLRKQAAQLEKENHNLAQNIAQIGTVQGIKRIASQMLDLVEDGANFFIPETTNP